MVGFHAVFALLLLLLLAEVVLVIVVSLGGSARDRKPHVIWPSLRALLLLTLAEAVAIATWVLIWRPD
jgi:hypothetical protein